MRVMHIGTCAAAVEHWQEFLRRCGLYSGATDGVFGPGTAQATRAFQRSAGITADGIVGPQTIACATARGMALPPDIFEIGPDRPDILVEARPYFLVPLDDPKQSVRVKRRILTWVGLRRRHVTDIYVITHGWHRNLFAAVSAYDRMAARMVLLHRRGRIRLPEDYTPLFLNIHWHSDPGADGWVDPAGARRKASFLQNARHAFVQAEGQSPGFTQDFEDLYELFSRMCAPHLPALGSWQTWLLNRRLAHVLERYRLRDAVDGTPAEKCVVAWMCWHEARPERIPEGQSAPPTPTRAPVHAARRLLRFARTADGASIAALAVMAAAWRPCLAWLQSRLAFGPISPWWLLAGMWLALQLPAWVYFLIAGVTGGDPFAADGSTMATAEAYAPPNPSPKCNHTAPPVASCGGSPLPTAKVGTCAERLRPRPGSASPLVGLWWMLLQFPRLMLLMGICGILYIVGPSLRSRWGIFDERIGHRSRTPNAACLPRITLLERIARWTARPSAWLIRTLPMASLLRTLATNLVQQLAFWTMQRKAVRTGVRAADFVAQLRSQCRLLRDARIHLIGHSFGALAQANTARHLALEHQMDIHSLCLLAPAMAADWFEGEHQVLNRITGLLGCVYSRYDTANSFYYPLANRGRVSAGMCGIAVGSPGSLRGSANLVDRMTISADEIGTALSAALPPFDEGGPSATIAQTPNFRCSGKRPRLLNLDASSLLYQGPPACGGGHDDIFKDDVVNLIWAITAAAMRARNDGAAATGKDASQASPGPSCEAERTLPQAAPASRGPGRLAGAEIFPGAAYASLALPWHGPYRMLATTRPMQYEPMEIWV